LFANKPDHDQLFVELLSWSHDFNLQAFLEIQLVEIQDLSHKVTGNLPWRISIEKFAHILIKVGNDRWLNRRLGLLKSSLFYRLLFQSWSIFLFIFVHVEITQFSLDFLFNIQHFSERIITILILWFVELFWNHLVFFSLLSAKDTADSLGHHHYRLQSFLNFGCHLFDEVCLDIWLFRFNLIFLEQLLPYVIGSYKKAKADSFHREYWRLAKSFNSFDIQF